VQSRVHSLGVFPWDEPVADSNRLRLCWWLRCDIDTLLRASISSMVYMVTSRPKTL
jgi:hypothetical protein